MNIFVFSVMAQRIVLVNDIQQSIPQHNIGATITATLAEAQNIAVQHMFKSFPKEEGFFGHSIVIEAIPPQMIDVLLKYIARLN